MYKRRSKRNPVAVVSPVARPSTVSSPKSSPIKPSQRPKSPMSKKRKETVPEKTGVEKFSRLTLTQSSRRKPYFEDVVASCGFVLDPSNCRNMLCQDQALFIRDVDVKLREHKAFPRNVDEFIDTFKEYCTDQNFKRALSPTQTAADSDVSRGPEQGSLIRLLLSVGCLQTKIIEFLFEKITEISFMDDSSRDDEDFPWIRTLLYQVRFLDHVVDSDALHNLLFAVLDAAPVPVQREVIFCLPDIIGDQQHDQTARKLSELLMEKFELTPVILDTLSNLILDPALRTEVSENVLKALRAAPVDFLPNIVQFLVTGTNTEDMVLVVDGLRKYLDFTPLSPSETDKSSRPDVSTKSSEVLTLANLKTSVIASRALAEAWLSAIKAVRMPSEHRCLDLVMLLVLHEAVPGGKKVVQAIFRNKAKAGLFKESLVEKTFSTLLPVLKEYRDTLIEVASALLRSPDPSVVYHASCWFRLALVHFEVPLGQAVVIQLLSHVGTGESSHVRAALRLLTDLAENHITALAPHQLLLLNMLDKLEDLALPEVEQVMDVLCRLAYGPGSQQQGAAIRNDVHMVIRKQFASSSQMVKKKGVVGAVMAAKHIASKSEEDQNSPDSFPDMEDKIGQAVKLMELVMTSTQACPEAIGLFFDKLSAVICKVEDLDNNLIDWISNHVGTDFEENYICYKKQLKLPSSMELQYEIKDMDDSTPDEDEDDVCIGLAQLVEKESAQNRSFSKMLTMNPSVRLVRCIKHLSDGHLGDVAALLGCGVVMPVLPGGEEVNMKDPDELKFFLDCMFFCTNWFRELLSAFSYQSDAELRARMKPMVLQRLADVVSLQRTLGKFLPHAIDYVPPPCQFYAIPKLPQPAKFKKVGAKRKSKGKGKKGKKQKKKKKAEDDSTEHHGAEDEEEEEEAEVEEEEDEEDDEPSVLSTANDALSAASLGASLPEYRGFLRELDVDVLILLREKLVLTPDKDTACLTPPLLLFLLEDFSAKLEHFLTATVKRTSSLKCASMSPVGFANLDTFSPVTFASNTVKMLPHLCSKLETVAEYCQNLLNESDGVRDAPSMFPEGSAIIKLCFGQLMRTIADLFAWNGFQSSTNSSLLKDGLRFLAGRLDAESAKLSSVRELIREAARYCQGYVERTVYLPSACALVKLLEALARISDTDTALKKQIADTCHKFLSQRWNTLSGVPERGSTYNQQVDLLLKTYTGCVEEKLQVTSDTVSVVLAEIQEKYNKKDWLLDVFPTITKSNFPLLYRSLCSTLVVGTQELLNTTSGEMARFEVWSMTATTLKSLMQIARLQSSRSNLVAFFKNALHILKLFLSKGLQVLGTLIRTKTAEVTALLQALQKSTRFLNTLCYHSKVTKDGALTQQVPAMRLVLEQMPISVRAMLTQNGCGDAFWLGVLRNRNLKGEEVLSQVEEPQDDLPPEDNNSEEEMDLESPEQNNSKEGKDQDNDDDDDSLSEVI
ncbi:Fanconi anemia group D2 protein [Anabrus simplex]|uniref:Fanconi anemia group D2 protein n=1 Tax=Anabrus simplex TaxID=316456 RepID=UPI0035A39D07